MNTNPTPIPVLAMRPRQAAEAIGVSERTLWSWTQAGDVPFIKRGKATLYPVRELQQWLSEQVAQPASDRERILAWHRENGLECKVFSTVAEAEEALRCNSEGGAR